MEKEKSVIFTKDIRIGNWVGVGHTFAGITYFIFFRIKALKMSLVSKM